MGSGYRNSGPQKKQAIKDTEKSCQTGSTTFKMVCTFNQYNEEKEEVKELKNGVKNEHIILQNRLWIHRGNRK